MVHKYPVAREAKRKASQRERERERASVLAHEPVRRYFRSIRSLPAALPTAAAHKRNGGKGEGQRGETGDGQGEKRWLPRPCRRSLLLPSSFHFSRLFACRPPPVWAQTKTSDCVPRQSKINPNLDSFSSLRARKLPFRVVVPTDRYASFTSSLTS